MYNSAYSSLRQAFTVNLSTCFDKCCWNPRLPDLTERCPQTSHIFTYERGFAINLPTLRDKSYSVAKIRDSWSSSQAGTQKCVRTLKWCFRNNMDFGCSKLFHPEVTIHHHQLINGSVHWFHLSFSRSVLSEPAEKWKAVQLVITKRRRVGGDGGAVEFSELHIKKYNGNREPRRRCVFQVRGHTSEDTYGRFEANGPCNKNPCGWACTLWAKGRAEPSAPASKLTAFLSARPSNLSLRVHLCYTPI